MSKPIDTTAGTSAYALALPHRSVLDPRLPAGTIDNLAADLTTLGAAPTPPTPPATPPSPPPAPPPTLEDATASVVVYLTAMAEAIKGSQAKPAVRKAYGISAKEPTKQAKTVLADGQKLVARAQANPSEALSLGILPADVALLATALGELQAAETAAKGGSGNAGGVTAKAKRAAGVRMHEAVTRIAGVGALAFATNAAVRAQFEALKPKKA